MSDELCPCGSEAFLADCCQPFIDGKTFPSTAEALMRSRYTAFVLKKVGYIQDTMTGPSLARFNPIETFNWLENVEWTGLNIISTEEGQEDDERGVVEFQAHYQEEGQTLNILERSEFEKLNDRWFYVSGEHY